MINNTRQCKKYQKTQINAITIAIIITITRNDYAILIVIATLFDKIRRGSKKFLKDGMQKKVNLFFKQNLKYVIKK